MEKTKAYGKPYDRKDLLKRGDIKKIAEKSGFSYSSIVAQVSGIRKMSPIVLALLNKFSEETINQIKKINNNR